MPGSFTVEELQPGAVPQALPLVRATWPEIDLAAWQDFTDAFHREPVAPAPAAITGLFDASGVLCGLFASRIEHHLWEGRILGIPLFTVVDIGNSPQPVRALLDAAEAKAKENGCAGMQIRLAIEQGSLMKRLCDFGLEYSGSVYSTSSLVKSTVLSIR